MKKAFITGINGQDGSYLSEYLLGLGYDVSGIIRRNSVPESQQTRLENIQNKNFNVYYGDVTDFHSVDKLIREIKPNEVYNLAAQSHVRISFDVPQFTTNVNSIGALNVLESFKNNCPDGKFYQASSSEMFGDSVDSDNYQRITTPMTPVSPYGCSKLYSYNIVRNYRKSYKIFASNGILFNHESPRRGSNFVTNKVVKTAVMIKNGMTNKLELGNLDSYRDWGHSKDYVKAMHLILQQDGPSDYVVATGETRSVRELCNYVFKSLGLNYNDHVIQNNVYLRPEELPYLRGDASEINKLGWKPEYSFEMMIDEMILFWERYFHELNYR